MKRERTGDTNGNLNQKQRHDAIVEMLMLNGSLTVGYISEQLNTSEVTIRKDLTLLESEKKLYRAHGKAILMDNFTHNRHINEKEKLQMGDKMAIGRAASALLKEGDSIIIGSGTTTLYFAKELHPPKSLTVLTSSIPVASIVSQKDIDEVVVLGGIMRQSAISTVGPIAENTIKQFACSKLFLGVDGIDLDFGITTTNTLEANLNRAMIESSNKLIIVADSTKFGRRGFSKICDVSLIDHIITDSGISATDSKRITDLGIKLTVVSTII